MKNITFATNPGAGSLEYIKLLMRSLRDNLDNKQHEILVFVDRDTDGILDYLRSIKNEFYDLKIVTHKVNPIVSYQRNSSLIVELAKYDIISYLHSDMVVSKGYDTAVLEELEEDTILSSTRIEPPLHPPSSTTFTKDFGVNPENFHFDNFIEYAESVKSKKTLDYFFAPYTFHKKTWQKLGGYDTMFRRSREDSDFVQRCLYADVKMKQTFLANVYHFTCVTSRGKNWHDQNDKEAQERLSLQNSADMIEMGRFFRKWGGFNHGEKKLKKYDIDLVVRSDDDFTIDTVNKVEPLFKRVWIRDENIKTKLLSYIAKEHDIANKLLNFSEEDWNFSKKFYNTCNYDKIFQVGEPSEYNIKLEIDLSYSKDNSIFFQNIQLLNDIIEHYGEGDYEFGSGILSIRKLKDCTPPYKVENPPFDMSLLTIE